MEHIPHLDQLALVAGLGVLVSVLLAKLRLPAVAGLLFAGALAGPRGLALVVSTDAIAALAEIGVMFLLFSIGLELSLERLRAILRDAAVGGVLQVTLTIAVTFMIARALGHGIAASVLYGFVFALSSTAIVLRTLTERRELDAPHGRFLVGALILQDLCVVPMVLVVPVLARGGEAIDAGAEMAWALVKAGVLVAAVLLVSRWLVPRALAWVDSSGSREVFLLAVLGLCLGTAWLTSLVGLSLALGAFLAGMMLAETDFGDRALGDVLPLRDAFVSIFFVSLGMLFDVQVVLDHPLEIALLLLAFVLGKGLIATFAALVMRFPARAAWLAGVGLANFGEFGFVLANLGLERRVIAPHDTQLLLGAGILSMFLTPLLSTLAPRIPAERALAPFAHLLRARPLRELEVCPARSGHVVVAGSGMGGRLVADALARCGIGHVVIDSDAQSARTARDRGEAVVYGEPTSRTVLAHAGLGSASALVLVGTDPSAVARAVTAARAIAPKVPILVRAHYVREGASLEERGASDVVSDEIETGVEIVARVLRRLEVPRNVIEARLREARSELPEECARRSATLPRNVLGASTELSQMKVDSLEVHSGSHAEGRTLVELDLRRRSGVTAFALRRNGGIVDARGLATTALHRGDVLFVVGTSEAVRVASDVLEHGDADPS
ncbi:cation:proton antiporter [Sandaracinus amylolyticus]|uniref:cation:proton antiporter domain-containing protein n=1 Tax=Sandaracinus amylolyticus TaxID=927083 RepID=UPI001F01C1A5|nr:cation:proton antiporter [Sandaracinus amylolyticus]UJR80454.1 Glutathione-regulated potassium-efflux system protein KefC [Sandaracinus amylolyticus]